MFYGCLFCMTGKEEQAAQNVRRISACIRTLTVKRQKRKKINGRTQTVEEICFPGYVFVESEEEDAMTFSTRGLGVMKLYAPTEKKWMLHGEDENFARWVFSRDGLISFSKAYTEGDRIKIQSGPLKDLEGYISRIDKRNQNGQICLEFQNRVIKLWLGYELIDLVP